MVRRSMRSKQYWIAECVTTAWSTYSSSRVMMRVTINGEVHTQVHAKPKIMQFHCKYPGAACHINVAIFDSIPFTSMDLATCC
jgi:hypothetical protein